MVVVAAAAADRWTEIDTADGERLWQIREVSLKAGKCLQR